MRNYSDQEKAAIVAELIAEGYPEEYALGNVSRRHNIPRRTLKRWYLHVRKEPTPEKVHEAKASLGSLLEDYLRAALPLSLDMIQSENASNRIRLKDLFVTIGIAVEKLQLLKGSPTQITEERASWKQEAKEAGIPEEMVIKHALLSMMGGDDDRSHLHLQ